MRARVLSPGDLLGKRVPRRPLVGGRAIDVSGERCTLADATTLLEFERHPEDHFALGDWLIVELERADETWRGRVVERHASGRSEGAGEVERLLLRGTGRRLAQRAEALRVIRRYFRRERFIEVDTPVRVPTPGLDVHVDALPAHAGFLVTSPEFQMKRLLVGGMPRIYQLVHCTRADERGRLHQPEFMMLEWYRAFASQDEVMADTEQVVLAVAERLTGKPRFKLGDGRRIELRAPFERLSVRQAFRRYAGIDDAVDLAASDEDRFFELLVDQVEPALARLDHPVFLWEYPATQASLARRAPNDPSVAERFELYVAGVELCNGFSELTCPIEQRRRFEADQAKRQELGRPVYPIDERFMAALHEGMPPSGGNALGVDRLIALATGAPTIADVQPFPAEWL